MGICIRSNAPTLSISALSEIMVDSSCTYRKTVEVVYETHVLCCVDFDGVFISFPVTREDYDSLWLDLLSDLASNFLEFGVGFMVRFFHDIWSSVGEEVDWCPFRSHCRIEIVI